MNVDTVFYFIVYISIDFEFIVLDERICQDLKKEIFKLFTTFKAFYLFSYKKYKFKTFITVLYIKTFFE